MVTNHAVSIAEAPMMQAQLAVDSRCELGEGILWDDREQALLWTDIHAKKLWRHVPENDATRSWTLPDRLASFALCESGKLLLGFTNGLYLADLRAARGDAIVDVQCLVTLDQAPSLRINDGRVDRSGNFVFGTLNEARDRAPIGRFYQFSMQHGLRELLLDGVAISNSIAFDLDGAGMFFCDTCSGKIQHCNYDADRAHTAAVKAFAEVSAPGSPDGSTIDNRGRLWNAQWGAGRVICYTREGAIEHVIDVPASQPSCVAFGGANFDRFYITTARENLDEALASEPDAGGVFVARVGGARGNAETRFRDT